MRASIALAAMALKEDAQWGLGLLIDGFSALGLAQAASFQAAMAVFLCCCIAAYGYFLGVQADNSYQ
ncbi:MAG: major facilitator superfamily 1 [Polaromonas sp.]|nr:major facilitator superfamily 1 [Polaromonas sp.]